MTSRETPKNLKMIAPVTAFYNTMKTQQARSQEEKKTADTEMKQTEALVCQTALAVYKFRRHLAGLTNQAAQSFQVLEDVLLDNDVEIVDYAGQVVDEAIQNSVSIEGWEDGTQNVEMVAETFTPEIRWRGKVLHTAQVFCHRASAEAEGEHELMDAEEKPAAGETFETQAKEESRMTKALVTTAKDSYELQPANLPEENAVKETPADIKEAADDALKTIAENPQDASTKTQAEGSGLNKEDVCTKQLPLPWYKRLLSWFGTGASQDNDKSIKGGQ